MMKKLITEYLDLPDIRIAYSQHGSGPTLILLHGNSGSKATFRKHQTKLFPDYHTIAIDSRGHGQSQSEDKTLSIEQISEDIIQFCHAKGITQAYVIGYSDGGNIALFLAKKAPQIFSRVIAISPNYLVSGTTEGSLRTIRNIIKIMSILNKVGFKMSKHLMCFDLMMRDIGLTEDALRSIQTKVKILYAEKDMIKEEHILKLAALIPNTEVAKVMRCSHLSIINDHVAITKMRGFLADPISS